VVTVEPEQRQSPAAAQRYHGRQPREHLGHDGGQIDRRRAQNGEDPVAGMELAEQTAHSLMGFRVDIVGQIDIITSQ